MLIGMAALATLPTTAGAQDDTIGGPISLKNKDGSLSVSGQLAGFEDGFYLIEIEGIGVLRIDSLAVECAGDGCPVLTPEFGIQGAEALATRLIPVLLRGYADSIGADYAVEETGDPATQVIRLTDTEGVVRAEAHVRATGSAGAFPALAEKEADIALADGRMTDESAESITAAGLSDLRDTEHERVIALDGTVLVVHPDNPVRSLSALEIARIYAGEIRNWSELGGDDVPVRANSLARGSQMREGIVTGFLEPNGLAERGDSFAWSSEEELAASVASDPGAIGYLGRSAALDHPLRMLALREPCGLVSPPTAFTIKTDGYRLARRLYAYKRPGRIHPEAQAFLQWMLSDAAQRHIKQAGFIDRSIERMRLEDMAVALIHTASASRSGSLPDRPRWMSTRSEISRLLPNGWRPASSPTARSCSWASPTRSATAVATPSSPPAGPRSCARTSSPAWHPASPSACRCCRSALASCCRCPATPTRSGANATAGSKSGCAAPICNEAKSDLKGPDPMAG